MQRVADMSHSLLDVLLFDRTSRKNILWATSDYEDISLDFAAGNEIKPELITGAHSDLIQSRVMKAQDQQQGRTREKAEVFTPSWVCNEQNNLIDNQWFGREGVFNTASGTTWATSSERIEFPQKGMHTWNRYVDAKRLEITCGEAPYLVSRYDTVTGEIIPIDRRIGLLDRKLRVVNENAVSEEEWLIWARRAVQSCYGYEFQGDNLLLARQNILFSYIEYYEQRLHREPSTKELNAIALIISWNLWQMDGMTYAIPFAKVTEGPQQVSMEMLLSGEQTTVEDNTRFTLCKIKDWRANETIVFRNLVKEAKA